MGALFLGYLIKDFGLEVKESYHEFTADGMLIYTVNGLPVAEAIKKGVPEELLPYVDFNYTQPAPYRIENGMLISEGEGGSKSESKILFEGENLILLDSGEKFILKPFK